MPKPSDIGLLSLLMIRLLNTVALSFSLLIGYFLGIFLSSLIKPVLEIIRSNTLVMLGLFTGLTFVFLAVSSFTILLALCSDRSSEKIYNVYSAIPIICTAMSGMLISLSVTEGFTAAVSATAGSIIPSLILALLFVVLTTVDSMTPSIDFLICAITFLGEWNISLLLVCNMLCGLLTLPLMYVCQNILYSLVS